MVEIIFRMPFAHHILEHFDTSHITIYIKSALFVTLVNSTSRCPFGSHIMVINCCLLVFFDIQGQLINTVWTKICHVVRSQEVIHKLPFGTTLFVWLGNIEIVGLYIERNHILFINLYYSERRVSIEMSASSASHNVDSNVFKIKKALSEIHILTVHMTIQIESDYMLVPFKNCSKSVPPSVYTFGVGRHMSYYYRLFIVVF